MSDITINVFTLNCWGIPVISKNRSERIKAIASYLSKSPHNIVCLQEIWTERDYLYIREQLKRTLPYSHYFYSGVLGSGLCVFSKWLIQDVFFHQWPLNGYIHKIHHGDWFGGKGVGLCRIKCQEKLINIYCTHLHAEYNVEDIYLAHRVLQAYSTAEFVNLTPADVSILAGDLNTAPGDLSFKLITQLPSLADPYSLDSVINNPVIHNPTGTCYSPHNSYTDPSVTDVCPNGKRIDHIFFHVSPKYKAEVINFGNPLESRVPGQQFSYSDHEAVSLELKIKFNNVKENQKNRKADDKINLTIQEAIQVCKDAMLSITRAKRMFLLTGGLIFMFLLGSVEYWPNVIWFDIIKLFVTGFCFYYLVMGTLWSQMEMNSLKAGLGGLKNFRNSRDEIEQSNQNNI